MNIKQYIANLFTSIFDGTPIKANHRHIAWITKFNPESLETIDKGQVKIFEMTIQSDPKILSDLAKHLRNHYEFDSNLDESRKGTNLTRKDFLLSLKFPDTLPGFGSSVRAGDFNEILFADYIEENLDFIVPRTRYLFKINRNESPQGTDIIGFKIINKNGFSKTDELITFESKSYLSKPKKGENPFQNALEDSFKDTDMTNNGRLAFSLNAMKQRLKLIGNEKLACLVERYQDFNSFPYQILHGAGSIVDKRFWQDTIVSQSNAEVTKRGEYLFLIIIGDDVMKFIHSMYERAANEA